MKITVEKNIKSNVFIPFIGVYDSYISYDEDWVKSVLERNDLSYSETLDFEKLSNLINFSWDGEVYFFPDIISKKVEDSLKKWFLNSQHHDELVSLEDTQGVFNFLLVKKVQRGLYIIDTQRDMNSTFPNFIDELCLNQDEYEFHSDCHLIDNIVLGRNDISRDIITFRNWYIDGIINESFFFHSSDLEEIIDINVKINIITKNNELLNILSNVSELLNISINSQENNVDYIWYDNSISENEISQLMTNHNSVLSIRDGIIEILKEYEDNNE